MSLTDAQVAAYQENGFLVVDGLVDAVRVHELHRRCCAVIEEEEAAADNGSGGFTLEPAGANTALAVKPKLRKIDAAYKKSAFFAEVIRTPALVDAARALTGGSGEMRLYADQMLLKPAFHGTTKPLHQDNAYFRVEPHDAAVTCWMPMVDATEENGCLRYIPGSHKWGLLGHTYIPNTPHQVPDLPENAPAEVAVPVRPGQVIFHHLLTIHCSGKNDSPNPRHAWAIHYMNHGRATAAHGDRDKMPTLD